MSLNIARTKPLPWTYTPGDPKDLVGAWSGGKRGGSLGKRIRFGHFFGGYGWFIAVDTDFAMSIKVQGEWPSHVRSRKARRMFLTVLAGLYGYTVQP